MAYFEGNVEKFQFYDWTVEVHRKAFRRRLTIRLGLGQPIRVGAGIMTTQKQILNLLQEKYQWILKNQTHFQKHENFINQFQLKVGEKFYFLGETLELKLVVTLNSNSFFSIPNLQVQQSLSEHRNEKNSFLLLHIPENNWKQISMSTDLEIFKPLLREFFKREARKVILQRCQLMVEKTQLRPTQIKFREPKTRWGSCNSKKVINLNWRLVTYPLYVIDYVILHEFCHLRYLNHSQDFWNLVEKFQPEYTQAEDYLKQNPYISYFLKE